LRAPSSALDGQEVCAKVKWEALMGRAIALGGRSRPHPNPQVGAIVLDDRNRIISESHHLAAGAPHAEVQALAEAGARARGGSLVVSLEPCIHFGRTPPCTETVITSGVARVVVGAVDPDTRVAGRGLQRLRAAGIEVISGVMADAVEAADPGYFHHRRTGRPLVTLKLAATLDGQIAARDGSSRWITGEGSRRDDHYLRAASDAVMVGAGTLLTDDPTLDVRLEGYAGPQPRPVVVAGSRPLPPHLKIFERRPLVLAGGPLTLSQAEVVVVPGEHGVNLEKGLAVLADQGLLTVMVEGGSRLAASLLNSGLVNALVVYLGGQLAGGTGKPMFDGEFLGMESSRPLRLTRVRRIQDDVVIEGRL